jgi:large subunit ribosomal protein L9
MTTIKNMQVIFLKDIKNVAAKGEVKNVADGYAFNFLLPKKMAEKATAEKIKQAETKKQKNQTQEVKIKDEKNKLAAKLNGKTIKLNKKANDKGHLFAAVSANEIAVAFKNEFGLLIDKDDLKLDNHIKEIGEHNCRARLVGHDIAFKVILSPLK